jgi:hypothetical protein
VRILTRRYDIGASLGGGAMADVYRAFDRELDRPVALKIMRVVLSADAELAQRFDREAEVIARVQHPNVVAVTDHGIAGDEHYMAMELIDGPTLQQLLSARGRLSEEETSRVGHEVAAGLAAAHAAGVIHRDLKPSNILISPDGHASVGDFGIAHLEAMTQLTRTGEVLGTPRYIAPEQVTGGVDARSDVYALGVVLYEMAVGHPPFDGDSPLEIVSKHLRERPVRPRRLVPALSKRFESVVMRALEKDPAKRFQTAAALRDALRPVESAPLVAFASRGSRVPAHGRAAGALFTTLAVLMLLTGVALARVGVDAWRPSTTAVAAASPTPEATAAPATAAPTPSPQPTVAPPTATPRPATPSTPVVTAPPLVPARTSAPAADEAAATVARFYQLVAAERFDEAAALWSPRMRAVYPPATNIYGRFSSTRTISLTGWSVASASATNATINVNIVEVMNDGSTRRWIGQWHMVRSGGAWLMDQPALARA